MQPEKRQLLLHFKNPPSMSFTQYILCFLSIKTLVNFSFEIDTESDDLYLQHNVVSFTDQQRERSSTSYMCPYGAALWKLRWDGSDPVSVSGSNPC